MVWGLLWWAGACCAWTPYDRQSALQDAAATDAAWKVDHLVPAGPFDGYVDCILMYKAAPSFKPNEEWCIYAKGSEHFIRVGPLSNLKSTAAQDSTEVAIPNEVVALLEDLWVNAILEARYSRIISRGLDGAVLTFGARIVGCGMCLAETWSPLVDLPPRWLVEAGEEVRSYARAASRDSELLYRDINALRDRLFEYYRVHGKH